MARGRASVAAAVAAAMLLGLAAVAHGGRVETVTDISQMDSAIETAMADGGTVMARYYMNG